jgi:integrase
MKAKKLSDSFLQSINKECEHQSGRCPLLKQGIRCTKVDDIYVAGREGLIVRRQPSGVITFRYRFRLPGVGRQSMVLGNYPAMSLSAAHDEHTKREKQVGQGLDPRLEREREQREEQRRQEREREKGKISIRSLIAVWSWHYARKKRVRPREAVRLLKKYLGGAGKRDPEKAGPWERAIPDDLEKEDAEQLLDKIARKRPVMANRVCSLAKQVFTFCMSKSVENRDTKRYFRVVRTNPFIGIESPGGEEKPIQRALSNDEIRVVWATLSSPDCPIGRPISLALRLLLVTGQRSQELLKSRITDFDLLKKEWTINPRWIKTLKKSERGMLQKTREQLRKNRRRQDEAPKEHVVPLSDLAISLVKQLITLAQEKNSPYLLPTHHWKQDPNRPLSAKALAHALAEHVVEESRGVFSLFGLTPFAPHDCRRTFVSGCTRIGLHVEDVGRVLNQKQRKKNDVTTTEEVYDKYEYIVEKRMVLDAWAKAVIEIIAGHEPLRVTKAA